MFSSITSTPPMGDSQILICSLSPDCQPRIMYQPPASGSPPAGSTPEPNAPMSFSLRYHPTSPPASSTSGALGVIPRPRITAPPSSMLARTEPPWSSTFATVPIPMAWRTMCPASSGPRPRPGHVVLHLRNRPYPDGMEDHVPRFQRAEAKAWAQELVNAFPGLRLIDRPIWHPDPKAQEPRPPPPSGELVKKILGVEKVARERVGPATETNNSPPGPSLETAGIVGA